jgi:hypothetical protein
MRKAKQSIHRRQFLSLSALLLVSSGIPFRRSSRENSVRFRIRSKDNGKELGLKIWADVKGRFILTIRELKGDRLIAIPLGKRKGTISENEVSKRFNPGQVSPFKVTMTRNAKITCDMDNIQFTKLTSSRDEGPSSEGFWSWLGDVVHDVVTGVAAAITWLTGSKAVLRLSGGGRIEIGPGRFLYTPGGGGFMLEPGMEEDPTIWY